MKTGVKSTVPDALNDKLRPLELLVHCWLPDPDQILPGFIAAKRYTVLETGGRQPGINIPSGRLRLLFCICQARVVRGILEHGFHTWRLNLGFSLVKYDLDKQVTLLLDF